MPKKKKNIIPEEEHIEEIFKRITDSSTRSERVSWNRKMKKMKGFIEKLSPIEDKILELHAQKEVIIDEVQILRGIMVKECVHPREYLIHKKDHIECKFCNKKIGASRAKEKVI